MEYVIGFFIALFIALTGVGAGTITVPVLVLFLGVPAPVSAINSAMKNPITYSIPGPLLSVRSS